MDDIKQLHRTVQQLQESQSAAHSNDMVNLVVQGGSFGLLCLIVIFLTRWIPKRIDRNDKVKESEAKSREAVSENLRKTVEIQAQVEAANREKIAQELRKAVEIQAAATVEATERLARAHAEQQRYERETCERRHQENSAQTKTLEELLRDMLTQLIKHYEMAREIKHEVTNLAQRRANEAAMNEARQRKGDGKGSHT